MSRLLNDVVPSHYDLNLSVDLEESRFEGTVTINVNIKTPMFFIDLHAADMTISEASLTVAGKEPVKANHTEMANERLRVLFDDEIQPGDAQLTISYNAALNESMKGFYRSKYVNEAGEEKNMACTQFESCDARRALPCFDEPAKKATFSVTITAATHFDVISNMPCLKSEPLEKNLTRHTFDKSPIMSTYLLAFVIGQFDYVEAKDSNGVVIRVYVPLGKKPLGEFGLDVAVKCLPFFTDYFGIAYPLPKLDLLAIPDFSAGAMENWGCVTYRPECLLVDPAESSISTKMNVALTVAHELAHQWFGNLVTMEWWTHLWLNEGFATWIEYFAVDKFFPQWNIWMEFVSSAMTTVLAKDAMLNSHPIEVDVKNEAEIEEIFDAISYDKGCCVIRMLVEFVGEENFRLGLQQYLKQHMYSNAETPDLWRALEAQSKLPVVKMMSDWTRRTGYPLITVEEVGSNADGQVQLKLTQSQFLLEEQQKEETPLSPISAYCHQNNDAYQPWVVPVQIRVAGQEPYMHMFEKREETITIKGAAPAAAGGAAPWVVLNAGKITPVRVKYSVNGPLYAGLLQALSATDSAGAPLISTADRLGILNDTAALCRVGQVDIGTLLELIRSIAANEDDYTVWSEIRTIVSQIDVVLKTSDASSAGGNDSEKLRDQFAAFARSLFGPIATRLGWEEQSANESEKVHQLRSVAITAMLDFGDKTFQEEATRRFSAIPVSSPSGAGSPSGSAVNTIPPDLRVAVYRHIVRSQGVRPVQERFEANGDQHEEALRCLAAIGASTNMDEVNTLLPYILDDNKVRRGDMVTALRSLANSKNVEVMQRSWDFIKEKWDDEIFPRPGGAITRVVNCFSGWASTRMADDIKAFFEKHPNAGAERAIKQILEAITSNARWAHAARGSLATFFEKEQSASVESASAASPSAAAAGNEAAAAASPTAAAADDAAPASPVAAPASPVAAPASPVAAPEAAEAASPVATANE